MLELLKARENERWNERERLRAAVRHKLKTVLSKFLPNSTVYVFGSLTEPFKFHKFSDVDIAVQKLADGVSPYSLQAQLEEQLERPVDLIEMDDSRIKHVIMTRGEKWIV